MSARLSGLPPVIDRRARVLILGSFPSAASLAAQQYYAHPRNQFWRMLGAVIGQPLKDMPYAARLAAAQAAGIAIWDIYASCERAGSLDSAIRNSVANDFAALKSRRWRYGAYASTAAPRRSACAKWRRWAMKPWYCLRPARPTPA